MKYRIQYFKLEEVDELYIDKLKDQIVIINRTINSFLFFIEQLGAKKTDFTSSLEELRNELSKNMKKF